MPVTGTYSYPGSATESNSYSSVDEILNLISNNTSNSITARDIRDSVYTLWSMVGSGSSSVFTSVTYNEMGALIASASVVPGNIYLINNSNVVENGVIVFGSTDRTISSDGIGNYMNADYTGVGTYSGVPSFTSNIGIWYSSMTASMGDVCIYYGSHYVNISGYNSDPSDIATWTFLSPIGTQSISYGYIPTSDKIIYDFTNDLVTFRVDIRGNSVYGAVSYFPWGNTNFTYNNFRLLNTQTDFRVARGVVKNCDISTDPSYGGINFTNFTGQLINVKFNSPSYVSTKLKLTNCTGVITNCEFTNGCDITPTLVNSSYWRDVRVNVPVTITSTYSLTNKTCEMGFSNFTQSMGFLQPNNHVSINITTPDGSIVIGENCIGMIFGSGTVSAIGSTGSNIIVDVTQPFVDGEVIHFGPLYGVSATVVGSPDVVTLLTYTASVGSFSVGELITDSITSYVGTCVFDDGIKYLGLKQVTGPFNINDTIIGASATSTLFTSTSYPSLNLSSVEYAGDVYVSSTNTNEITDNISGITSYYPVNIIPSGGLTMSLQINGNFKNSGNIIAEINGSTGDWIQYTNRNGTIYQTGGDTY